MKNDYKRNYFWVIPDMDTNKNRYYFNINGKLTEVDKQVFNVCYNSYKKQRRDLQKDMNAGIISLDDDGNDCLPLIERVGNYENMLDRIDTDDKVKKIMKAIDLLDIQDCELITNLLINEKTERELARQLNVSQVAIHKKKNRILKKIRKDLIK